MSGSWQKMSRDGPTVAVDCEPPPDPAGVEGRVVLALGGDVMIGRLVNRSIALHGYVHPWGDVLPLLGRTDLNLVNLEAALTTCSEPVPKVFNFRADPDRVHTLQAARIDVVTLANNHVLDYGPAGLEETLVVLERAGIAHVGAGKDAHGARSPVVLTRNGLRIGILGCTDNEPGWAATEGTPGTFYVRVGDLEPLRRVIAALRPEVDLLVLSMHWGPNMRERPTPAFVRFARTLVDLGVDILHGHSAHLVQGIEWYRGSLILYDTGDFVDDYAVDPQLRNDRSFLFLVEVDRAGIRRLCLVPVLIGAMQVNLALGDERTETIARMARLCAEMGTSLQR